jgi:N-acetylglucosamine kinase-like BadF-type ATPase
MTEQYFFLGFDGGGTKTDGAIVDSEGRILAEARAGPSNPTRIGFSKACASLGEAAHLTLVAAGVAPELVRAVCAGMAGAARPQAARRMAKFLERAFPQADVRVTTDLEIALEAAVGSGEGIVLVAGTGSAAFGRNRAGTTARAGGEGPKKGDAGSAFDIGRRAFEAALRAHGEQGPPTLLSEAILNALSCRDWDLLVQLGAENPDALFPGIFPMVIEVAEAGDSPAREILASAARALAGLVRSVSDSLGLTGKEVVIAKSGGAFGQSALLDTAVEEHIKALVPRARINPLRIAPSLAAAEMARQRAVVSQGLNWPGVKKQEKSAGQV